MPELQVSIALPYYLRIAQGKYETGQAGDSLRVVDPQLVENEPPRTSIQAHFTHADTVDANEIQRLKTRDADQLLWRTNRLLRWYRSVTHRADVLELTRAQASPFRFAVTADAADPAWNALLPFEGGGPVPLPLPPDELTGRVQAGLASGNEPDVAELFLLDAASENGSDLFLLTGTSGCVRIRECHAPYARSPTEQSPGWIPSRLTRRWPRMRRCGNGGGRRTSSRRPRRRN